MPLAAFDLICEEAVSTDTVRGASALYYDETCAKSDLASLDDIMRVQVGADMCAYMGIYTNEGSLEKLLGPDAP